MRKDVREALDDQMGPDLPIIREIIKTAALAGGIWAKSDWLENEAREHLGLRKRKP